MAIFPAACLFTLPEPRDEDVATGADGGGEGGAVADGPIAADGGDARAGDGEAAPGDAGAGFRRADFEEGSLVGARGADRADPQIVLAQPGLGGGYAAQLPAGQPAELTFDIGKARPDVTVAFRLLVRSNAGKRPRIALFRDSTKSTASLVLAANGQLEADFGVFGDPGFDVGSSTVTLATGTVYRVELRYAAGTGTAVVEARVAAGDGVPARFALASTYTGGDPTEVALGATTTVGADIVIDDIVLREGP